MAPMIMRPARPAATIGIEISERPLPLRTRFASLRARMGVRARGGATVLPVIGTESLPSFAMRERRKAS